MYKGIFLNYLPWDKRCGFRITVLNKNQVDDKIAWGGGYVKGF